MKCLVKNGLVFYQEKFSKLDILIEEGITIKIAKGIEIEEDIKVIDASNKIVTSSFIDVHTHLRTPGYEYKEDLKTGSKAALKGGYSHICTMPNTKPCLDNYERLNDYLTQIKKESLINILPFSAATIDLKGQELVDVNKISELIIGFSDDGKGIQSDELMKELLIKAGQNKRIVAAHCEDEGEFIDGMGSLNKNIASKHHQMGINNESEWKMIDRDLRLVEQLKDQVYHYHVCHISTKESLDLIKLAQAKDLPVSCEVTPHHLISNELDIDINNANYKMNPPLRSIEDVDNLIEGLRLGYIQMIATDHAPHSDEEKQLPLDQAPFGIIGLELAFSLLYTKLVKTNKVEIETIIKAMSNNPSKIFKIDNQLDINKKAYLNIIDLDEKVIYTKDNLASKASNTPYLNEELSGKISEVIFEDKYYKF